jgi:hypothetical protein
MVDVSRFDSYRVPYSVEKTMTVKELIEYLEKLPKDTVIGVVYTACSDVAILEERELQFVSPGEITGRFSRRRRFIIRQGRLMEYDEKVWDHKTEGEPKFVPVLVLPGN